MTTIRYRNNDLGIMSGRMRGMLSRHVELKMGF